MPKLHRSDRASTGCPRSCSGDIYFGVPAARELLFSLSAVNPVPPSDVSASLAIPKSRTLTDRKSTRLNSSHSSISYAVFCLKKKKKNYIDISEDEYVDEMIVGVRLHASLGVPALEN